MTGRCDGRRGWELLWVVAVLAALVHSLLCAHGPLTAAAPADSLPVAAAHCPGAAGPHDGGPHDRESNHHECAGEDQPVTAHQDGRPLPAPVEAPLTDPAAAAAPARPATGGPPSDAPRRGGGRTRAVLGVWRT
ncbi:hypothetical protein ACFVUN_09855 [Kitasatospora griseola]|uniref:hypothetical protein n=1 Tax=Kitasatospora griseola TaxID=2064 RepID=UPI0036DDC0FA